MKSPNVFIGKRNRLRSVWLLVVVVISVMGPLLFPALSPAVDLSGDSRTYVQSRQTADNAKILGAYEYLDFVLQDIGGETITFHSGGWLRYDLKDEEFGRKTDNDLQYSYLSFKEKTGNTIVNLGRIMVFEGVAAERVDGLYARTDLVGNFAIAAFGGVPVETELDQTGNNSIYGGRLTQQIPGLYRIGLSYLKEEKRSADFRKEEGLDLWFLPFSKVELVGRSSYNAVTAAWMEHNYSLVLGPFDKLRLTTDVSSISYKDYFTGTTNAAFKFQAGLLDPKETMSLVGETISYAVTKAVNVSLDYKAYSYDIAGDAKYFGGSIGYSSPASGGAGLSLHRMAGDADRLRYSEYRVYGFKKIDKTDVAVDLLDVKYDSAINGVSNAYSATVSAGYELTEKLKLGADIEYSRNPDFDKDVRAFIKAIYRFDVGSGARKGA